MKKPSISTIIIFIVILLAVGGLVFLKGTKQINAPTETELTSTSTAQVTQSTTTSEQTISGDTPVSNSSLGATTNGNTQVIYGDGYITEITKVPFKGILPEIKSFKLDSVSASGVCRFSWEASKAETCNFVNVTTNTQVSAAGDEGIIQTSEKGDYQIKCMGKEGGSVKSEVVSCK